MSLYYAQRSIHLLRKSLLADAHKNCNSRLSLFRPVLPMFFRQSLTKSRCKMLIPHPAAPSILPFCIFLYYITPVSRYSCSSLSAHLIL